MREHNESNALPELVRDAEIIEIGYLRDKRHKELLSRARGLMLECNNSEAMRACEEALRLVPDSKEALVLASTLSAVQGSCHEGLIFALEMLQLDPTEADGYYEVAMCLLDMDLPEVSLTWLDLGQFYMRERQDDLVDFLYAAQAEAFALLLRYDEADEKIREANNIRGDRFGLIRDAKERIDWLKRRSEC